MKEVICIDDNFGPSLDLFNRPTPSTTPNPKEGEICQVIAVLHFREGPCYKLLGYSPNDYFGSIHFQDITSLQDQITSALKAPVPKLKPCRYSSLTWDDLYKLTGKFKGRESEENFNLRMSLIKSNL